MSDIKADAAWPALNKLIDPDCRNGKHRSCVGGLCECSCHWTSKEATDDLATLLADEEHRQGAPYLADPDHCARCAEVDHDWARAMCGHQETVSIRTLDRPVLVRICTFCGDVTEEQP